VLNAKGHAIVNETRPITGWATFHFGKSSSPPCPVFYQPPACAAHCAKANRYRGYSERSTVLPEKFGLHGLR
jgi:hypothetical protein